MVRVHVKSTVFTAGLLTLVIAAGSWVSAQRGASPAARAGAPSGAEIAAAARAGRLDHGNAATATAPARSHSRAATNVRFRSSPITKTTSCKSSACL